MKTYLQHIKENQSIKHFQKDEDTWIEAAEDGNLSTIKKLIAKGIDVNLINGWTALMQASNHGHPDVVRELINAGANVNLSNKQGGRTALMLASKADYGSETVQMLLDAGADPNAQNKDGWTALMYAVDYGTIKVLKILLQDKRVKLDIKNKNGQDFYDMASDNIKKIIDEIKPTLKSTKRFGL